MANREIRISKLPNSRGFSGITSIASKMVKVVAIGNGEVDFTMKNCRRLDRWESVVSIHFFSASGANATRKPTKQKLWVGSR